MDAFFILLLSTSTLGSSLDLVNQSIRATNSVARPISAFKELNSFVSQ
jgi:hypothetical protein